MLILKLMNILYSKLPDVQWVSLHAGQPVNQFSFPHCRVGTVRNTFVPSENISFEFVRKS